MSYEEEDTCVRSKWGRKIVRRPRQAKSDCPTPGDRGAALTLVRLERVMRPGLTAGAAGPGSLYSIIEYE